MERARRNTTGPFSSQAYTARKTLSGLESFHQSFEGLTTRVYPMLLGKSDDILELEL